MRKISQKIIAALTAGLSVISLCSVVSAADYKSEALNAVEVENVVSLGSPITELQVQGSCVDVLEDGTTMFYGVANGDPGTFFSYNIDTGEVEDIKYLQSEAGDKAKLSYGVDMGPDGLIYISTQAAKSLFFRYNPATKEMKCYGIVGTETAVMARGCFDSQGNYYFGTYPGAKLMKFDVKAEKLVDLGQMISAGQYARTIGSYGDKIFVGGLGTPVAEIVQYDASSGKRTVIPNPEMAGTFEKKDIGNVPFGSTAGKYLFARCRPENIGGYYMCVYDIEKGEWLDFIPRTMHMNPTDFDGDVVYYHAGTGSGNQAKLFAYNPATKENTPIEGVELTTAMYMVSPKIVTLKNQEKYPGKTLVAASNMLGIMLINLENKSVEFIKDALPAQVTPIRTIKAGYDGDVILSAYMGSKVLIYNTNTDTMRMEAPSVQIEGMGVFDGKYYFGLYGHARLTEFDPKQAGSSTNPKQLADMSDQKQDRAFNVIKADDNIVWASYPNYGKLGGAIGVYNTKTKAKKVFDQPVENQCFAGLAYKDGKIYASTSVYGGLGISAIDAPAKMIIIDLESGKLEKQVDVKLTADKNTQYFVGDMTFDENGKLWVATVRTLLEVNPDTLEIIREIPIGAGTHSIDKVRALPYMLEFGKDGLMYTNIGNRITAVDVTTFETKELHSQGTNGIAVVDNGNLYFMDGNTSNWSKLVLTRGEEVDKTDVVLKASIVLQLGSPNALVRGAKALIDPENDQVVAQTVNSRTLLPVRFIAESYGAKVDWNDETQTATLVMPGKTVNITLGENLINLNGKDITIDVPAQTIQDRTMLPLRAFAEQVMDKKVFWDDRGLIVISDSELLDSSKDADIINELIEKVK